MPDLVGLTDADARELLTAIGLTELTFVDQQQIGEAGVIIKQQPSPGVDASGTITLTVRTELPPLPNYEGRQIDDVVAELEEWGVQAAVENTVDESRPDGEILRSVPSAGSQIGQQVELTVATEPTTLYLNHNDAPIVDIFLGRHTRSGGYRGDAVTDRSESSISVDGSLFAKSTWVTYEWSDRYDDLVGGQPSSVTPSRFDLNLGRDWSLFRATAGIGDTSQSPVEAVFRVIVDDQLIEEHLISIGSPVEIEVPVDGALRLRLEVEPKVLGRGQYVWGDARLVGAAGNE